MARKRTEKESDKQLLVGIKREMAKPRMTKSARESKVMVATPRILKRNRGKAKP
jgi:hypothetical protein